CIKEWRKTDSLTTPFQTTDTTKTCPVCRKNSPYIVPSSSFAKEGPKKDEIVKSYKDRLSQIPCKYFQETRKCPFANKCFYKHANPDGTKCDLGPPKRKKPRTCLGNFRYWEYSPHFYKRLG
ncbi:19804_t:CDS:2, partial [Racocetra persica]